MGVDAESVAEARTGSGSEPVIRVLGPSDEARWTEYLAGHPDATLYHTLPWREVIARVFGHRPQYLLAERGGRVVGLLPLFLVRFPGLGAKLISLPYDIGSGGPLASDPEAAAALARAAVSLARERRVNYLELRLGGPAAALEGLGLVRSEPVVISDMDLTEGEKVWSRVSTDNRQSIRKARKRGVVIREASSLADCDAFYEVYLRAFRAFGTPPYGPTYFPTVWEQLASIRGVRLLLAEVEGRTVGGLVLYCLGRNFVSKFAACLADAVPLRAYAALYGAAIDLALAEGATRLSWGTSATQQEGLIDFKRRWGASGRPAALYAHAVRRAPPSLARYYDDTGLERRVWRRLPLRFTAVAGGILSRWFC
jgi:Acetyltransferase (GNAT) domain